MRPTSLSLAAVLTGVVMLGAVAPAEAGQRECWAFYHDAWEKMQRGNHKGYENQMRKYNICMNRNWEGPVPKKKHNM